MRGRAPAVHVVTGDAQFSEFARSGEEFSVEIVVGVVTGRALQLLIGVETDFVWQRGRTAQLSIRRRQARRVIEADGVVVGEVGAQVCQSGGNVVAAVHSNLLRAAEHASECDRSVMTTQAELARSGGLARMRVQSGGVINLITGRGHLTIPQRTDAAGVVRGMAEDANLRFGLGVNATRSGGG